MGGAVEVGHDGVDARAGKVSVRIDKARQQRPALEFDDAGAPASPREHVFAIADGADAGSFDTECRCNAPLFIHRDHGTTEEHGAVVGLAASEHAEQRHYYDERDEHAPSVQGSCLQRSVHGPSGAMAAGV